MSLCVNGAPQAGKVIGVNLNLSGKSILIFTFGSGLCFFSTIGLKARAGINEGKAESANRND